MISIKKMAAAGVAIAALMSSAVSHSATELRVGTWLPPTDNQNAIVWPTWAKWVEEATEGRVRVKLEYGLGHPKTMFQLVEDGVVDASFSYHGYVPGRFKLPQIVEQPGLGVGAEAASVALWRVYDKYFRAANEFEGLEVLGMFTHGQGTIQSNFRVTSLADLEGKKIRVGGGIQTELSEKMKVTPVSAPATKAYEMLQQGVIDGIFMPMAQQKSLRLSEVTKYITIFPEGMYMGSFSMFINPDFLDSLSERDRKAIMSVSGEKLSRMAGAAWEEGDGEGFITAKADKVEINEVGAAQLLSRQFNTLITGMDKLWIDSVADRKVDAEAALAELRNTARNYHRAK
ncbi:MULTISPECIES: TRAP transporter substrate-binding protein [unclassified Oceanobacter]|uniref:TRAP transporter substrate-binding protein n=1 Tax=unclassified Oceanobacter TaxID=2620260 RepID=UPI0027354840|nr:MULTISPECIES: TRAP transporter substrate-binding protein [unclassified Oceanobacter]MDP2549294.1 TRAP transporter substrate-binding protein [Oceanobacter sp. 4_MG-2023]MDP2609068.1 TRAP transporter substrate-binding protein [Oceanobacter sp. 1_MG-2023]MDP2612390.1 TRAP transporter substrate-binding protein [Oceanobacter sp. 2_MG-2023]